jgi:hypothetical protein
MNSPTKKVKLISDFMDYYDIYFDFEGTHWERKCQTPVKKREDFARMAAMGLHVPPNGLIVDLAEAIPYEYLLEVGDNADVVLYTGETEHAGLGKLKMNIMEAYEGFDGTWASMYIEGFSAYPQTTRWLKVGNEQMWLTYTSLDDSWRSNAGDVAIIWANEIPWTPKGVDINKVVDFEKETRGIPLCAIDFVCSHARTWYAIDFNTAPGLQGSPVENWIPGRDVAQLIKDYLEETGQC